MAMTKEQASAKLTEILDGPKKRPSAHIVALNAAAAASVSKAKIVKELCQLYAHYGLQAKGAQRKDALAHQSAISQVMLRLGVVEECRQRLGL